MYVSFIIRAFVGLKGQGGSQVQIVQWTFSKIVEGAHILQYNEFYIQLFWMQKEIKSIKWTTLEMQ